MSSAFSGGRTYKLPLTHQAKTIRGSAPSLNKITGKRYPRFRTFPPLMVELFAAGLFNRTPSIAFARPETSQSPDSPRQPKLNEPFQRKDHEPLGGIFTLFAIMRPAILGQAFLCRPGSRGHDGIG